MNIIRAGIIKFLNIVDTFLRFFPVIIFIIALLFYCLFNKKCVTVIEKFFWGTDKIGDPMVTLVSIFAGVFFSLIILLITLPKSSIIKSLNKKDYSTLIHIVFSGFLVSILYVVFQIIRFFNDNLFVQIILLLLILEFFTILLQAIVYFSLVFVHDTKSTYDALNDMEIENDIKDIKFWVDQQRKKENY